MTAEPVITVALLREAANTLTRIVSSSAFRQSRNAAPPTDEQRRQAEWARLNAQIERWRKQARWEPWKALAAIVGAAALMIAAALAVSHWHVPQTINANVHLVKP